MVEDIYLIVESISLLTITEIRKLPKDIREINTQYWLQSPGSFNDHCVAISNRAGSVDSQGSYIHNFLNVRPVLLINNFDLLNLPLYTELEIFDKEWIYIGNNKALAKTYLWRDRFDRDSNDYKTSEIKRKLDYWLIEQKAKYRED